MSIDNDLLYHGIENRHFPVYSSLSMSLFLSLQIFRIRYLYNYIRLKFIFGIQNNNDKLHGGIDIRLCPVCSSLYLLSSLSVRAINTVIFRNRFLSNLSR